MQFEIRTGFLVMDSPRKRADFTPPFRQRPFVFLTPFAPDGNDNNAHGFLAQPKQDFIVALEHDAFEVVTQNAPHARYIVQWLAIATPESKNTDLDERHSLT